MKVIIFGTTGMVGAGALREALNAPEVAQAGRVLLKPVFPLFTSLVRVFPFLFTTSEILGRAMLRVVEGRADRFILASADINRVGA